MTNDEKMKEIAKKAALTLYDDGWPDTLTVASEIESAIKESTASLNQTIAELTKQNEELVRDKERLENWLANELGIEKSESNAGDDPALDYWIGVDNKCYESRRTAIDTAMQSQDKEK